MAFQQIMELSLDLAELNVISSQLKRQSNIDANRLQKLRIEAEIMNLCVQLPRSKNDSQKVRIVVKNPAGNVAICLEVDPSDTIKSVKDKIAEAKCVATVPADEQILSFADKRLLNDDTLSQQLIGNGSILRMTRRYNGLMQMSTFIDGTALALFLEPLDTILDIKYEIEKKRNIPANQQRLLWNGMHLEDCYSLSDYNIPRRCELRLVRRRASCSECSKDINVKTIRFELSETSETENSSDDTKSSSD